MTGTRCSACKVLPAELLPLREEFNYTTTVVPTVLPRSAQILALPISDDLKSSLMVSAESLPVAQPKRYVCQEGERRDWGKTLHEALVKPCFLGLLIMLAIYASLRDTVSAFRTE